MGDLDPLDPYDDYWPPVLPPLLSGQEVPAGADPLPAAVTWARGDGDPGAVFFVPDRHRLRLAIVLSPEVERARAVQMGHALMLAFGDAIGALAPPEVGVHYRWPAAILVNGAVCGRLRLALAEGSEDAAPDWLAVGLELWLTPRGADEPGDRPETTALYEEGTGPIPLARLIEATCRHFLTWLHRWESDGFAPLREAWNARRETGTGELDEAGRVGAESLETVAEAGT